MDNPGRFKTHIDMEKDVQIRDLEACLNTSFDQISPQVRFYARTALGRLAKRPDIADSYISIKKLFALHAESKTQVGRRWSEERSALVKLINLPDIPERIAHRIQTGIATMSDALSILSLQNWGGEEIRVRNCYARFEEKLLSKGVILGEAPAAEVVLERYLAIFTHLDFGMQTNAWNTMKSRLRRVARLADVNKRTRLSSTMVSDDWRALIAAARGSATTRGTIAKLWPLVAFSSRHKVAPTAVTDDVLANCRKELERRGRINAFAIVQSAVYAWEVLSKTVVGWPTNNLSRIYQVPGRSGRPRFADLPGQLKADWTAFADKFGNGEIGQMGPQSLSDLVVDDLYMPALQISPSLCTATLVNLKSGIIGLAEASLNLNRIPDRLIDLIDPEVVLMAVKNHQKKQCKRSKSDVTTTDEISIKNYGLLQVVARAICLGQRIGAPEKTMRALEGLRDRVDPRLIKIKRDGKRQYRQTEIGGRHRNRIAAFNDPVKMYAWLEMPQLLYARMRATADAKCKPSLEDIGDAIVAVLYAVSLCCPMRRSNLAQLTICGANPKIWIPPAGRAPGKLRVAASEVKNDITLNAEIDMAAVKVLMLWMEYFRPVLMSVVGADPRNPYLLPAAGLKYRAPELLNKGFVDRNRNAGFLLNLHCQRHLCAKVILDEDPSQMALVQRFLGHKSIKTTERYYAEVNAILVQRKFHLLLEARRLRIFGEVANAV